MNVVPGPYGPMRVTSVQTAELFGRRRRPRRRLRHAFGRCSERCEGGIMNHYWVDRITWGGLIWQECFWCGKRRWQGELTAALERGQL